MKYFLGRIAILAALLGLWQLLSGRVIDKLFLSAPSEVIPAIGREFKDDNLLHNLWITCEEAGLGYLLGASVGILAALAFAWYPTADRLLYPLMMAANGIPRVALAPLFLIWFGIGLESKVFLVFTTVVFIVFMNTLTGLKEVDLAMVNLMRSMNAREYQIFAKSKIPNALPYIFIGLRISVPYAFIGAIVGEFLSASEGVGYALQKASAFLATDEVMALVIILASLVLVVNETLSVVERRIFRWKPTEERLSADSRI